MDLQLKGKRVAVTGATRGIGRAIVRAFAAEGAAIALCARGAAGVDEVVAETRRAGVNVSGSALDVRDPGALKQWLHEAAQALGGLDIVISNVSTRIDPRSENWWRETFDTDFHQHVRTAEFALPWLLQGREPALIFLSSIAAVLTRLPPGEEAYGAMKAALINYAGQLAEKHGPAGLRVNCVSPGPIYFEGGVWHAIQQRQPELFKSAAQLAALRRHGAPEHVANAVVFLASPASAHTTGVNLRVDGGAVKAANF